MSQKLNIGVMQLCDELSSPKSNTKSIQSCMSAYWGFIKFIFMVVSILLFSPFDFVAQAFQNGSLEIWGNSDGCLVNSVPDGWVGYSNDGINFDECDFAVCGSTIPAQAADGTVYGRAYSGSTTSGEGIVQEVTGFLPGNEYQISFEFAGSNLLPGFNASQWHIFLDDVDVDQTTVFSSTEDQWNTHTFSFFATSASHLLGFRAFNANVAGGSAAIDNFQIQLLTPDEPVLPVAAFVQSEQVICVGECIVFTNNSQFATEVSWIFESGNPATSGNTDEVVVCYNQPGVYTVELMVTNEDGVDAMVVEQLVTVISIPVGSLILSGDSLMLTTDVAIGDFIWTLNGNPLPESGYLITPVESGFYEVNLQNETPCNTSLSLLVEEPELFNEPETIEVWIPNAMTCGDDGINDVWGVFGELSMLETFTAQVFNRWGEKVFETEDPSVRWTGNAFSGSHYVPDGVYLFTVNIKFQGEIERRRYQGHITVIR
jgi:gliding motility-associated-like protein